MRLIDQPISSVFGYNKNANMSSMAIGIEIEAEGKELVTPAFMDQNTWVSHEEGSLRGGVEYVLRRPTPYKGIKSALDLWKDLTKSAKFDQSLRTSVHIHYNVRYFSFLDIYKVLTAYWLVENLLVNLNGKDRKGNLFCLRLCDAEHAVEKMVEEIKSEHYFHSWTEDFRYLAVNLSAIRKFGSLEFRFIRGLTDADLIYEWVEGLMKLIDTATKFKSPLEILNYYYRTSGVSFLKEVLTPALFNKIRILKKSEIENEMLQNTGALYEIASLLNSAKKVVPIKFQAVDEDLVSIAEPKKKRLIASRNY